MIVKSNKSQWEFNRSQHLGYFNARYSRVWIVLTLFLIFGQIWASFFYKIVLIKKACSYSTLSFSLSPPWKRVKYSPRHFKVSKIFPGEHSSGPPLQVCILIFKTHPSTKNPGYAQAACNTSNNTKYVQNCVMWLIQKAKWKDSRD